MPRAVLIVLACLVLAGAALPAQSAESGAPPTVAVLDFELVDTSLEGASYGADKSETARLGLISRTLRELLEASGKYKVVDIGPARGRIADAGLIHGCNGCETQIAASLGAERVITGTIQKISTLILTLTIFERDVATGKLLQVATAQIRGNTDQSWTRGVTWLTRNRLLAEK